MIWIEIWLVSTKKGHARAWCSDPYSTFSSDKILIYFSNLKNHMEKYFWCYFFHTPYIFTLILKKKVKFNIKNKYENNNSPTFFFLFFFFYFFGMKREFSLKHIKVWHEKVWLADIKISSSCGTNFNVLYFLCGSISNFQWQIGTGSAATNSEAKR